MKSLGEKLCISASYLYKWHSGQKPDLWPFKTFKMRGGLRTDESSVNQWIEEQLGSRQAA